jgi:hypothetical protein
MEKNRMFFREKTEVSEASKKGNLENGHFVLRET